MEKNCLQCGETFPKPCNCSLSAWKKRKFCSRPCGDKYKIGRKLNYGSKISVGLKLAYSEGRRSYNLSDSGRMRLSIAGKGRIPWNKGKKTGLVPRSAFKKGMKAPKMCFKKGNIPWNKGIKRPEMSGEKHPNWKGGLSKLHRTERQLAMNTLEYKKWRRVVFGRDNYTCQICDTVGGRLVADHIKPWSLYPELRYNIDNGRTLCVSCDKKHGWKDRGLQVS